MTRKQKKTLLAALAIALMPACTTAQDKRVQQLLPMPTEMTMGKGTFATDGPIKVESHVADNANCVFTPTWAKPQNNSDTQTGSNAGSDNAPGPRRKGQARVVRYLPLGGEVSPEAYRLHITPDTLDMCAASATGFMHAWQTIAQLTTKNGVACADIHDKPAYKWRGLMIDVVRHFFSIDFLKRQIDVMAQYKLNTLHLHLTDAEGWRMEIKRYPRLTDSVAYRPIEPWVAWREAGQPYCSKDDQSAYGGYYTQDQLRDLVAYAADRGITIVPEIEMPGHSGEVTTAYPELSCTHEPHKQPDYCAGSIATYDFLENVLREVMDVFPSTYIHVGGDEAAKKSWPTCPLCQRKMHELGIDDTEGLQAYLITQMGQFLNKHGRQLVGWDEVIAGNLSKNTTVMVWRGTERAHEAIEQGYDVVLSPGAYCYLDHYQDAPALQRPAIGGYLPLEKVYSYIPGEDLPEAERKHITGIQGNLWTEHIATTDHVEQMLWPRALALAEIGWNGTPQKDYAAFRRRAIIQVDRLAKTEGMHPFDLRHEAGQRPEALHDVANKAAGATVTYNRPYNKSYAAGGERALVDGKRGGWSYSDGRWQGFTGTPAIDVTIDLGKTMPISSVEACFMQMSRPGVNLPSQFTVEASTDGHAYDTLYDAAENEEKTEAPLYRTHRWHGHAKARYLHVKAMPSSFGGFVMCDEIVVK